MRVRLLSFACAGVLCITLTLGLWPFHVPRNDVSWLGNRNGLHFGGSGTVFSDSAFMMTAAGNRPSCSLEIWLQSDNIWRFSTFLVFYVPGNPVPFSLHQSQTSLSLQTAIQDNRHHAEMKDLYVEHAFRATGPTFITVTSGAQGTAVYLDGTMAKREPQSPLCTQAFAGRLVLGDSAEQGDSWSGKLLGLAIYDRELTPPQVLEHYETWTQRKRSKIPENEGIAAYSFDERTGKVIHSRGGSGPELQIPETYTVLGQAFLESPWSEFRRSELRRSNSFWSAVNKNIIGFIPLGFCFCAYFSFGRRTRRAVLATVTFGIVVSFTIEVLQAFLPTRDSGVTDLITNTLGTYIGVLLYRAAKHNLGEWWPW